MPIKINMMRGSDDGCGSTRRPLPIASPRSENCATPAAWALASPALRDGKGSGNGAAPRADGGLPQPLNEQALPDDAPGSLAMQVAHLELGPELLRAARVEVKVARGVSASMPQNGRRARRVRVEEGGDVVHVAVRYQPAVAPRAMSGHLLRREVAEWRRRGARRRRTTDSSVTVG
eukprot:scaffold17821_cov139-Isochrysis_galbana.AAC.3